jgi:hypothetical protein
LDLNELLLKRRDPVELQGSEAQDGQSSDIISADGPKLILQLEGFDSGLCRLNSSVLASAFLEFRFC